MTLLNEVDIILKDITNWELMVIESKNIKSEQLNGIYEDIANLLDVDAALIIYKAFKGHQVTFPVSFFSSEYKKNEILKNYNGYNFKELSTQFEYSEKWVRKLIKEHISKNV